MLADWVDLTSSYSWPSIVTEKHNLAGVTGRPSGAATIGISPVHAVPWFLSDL